MRIVMISHGGFPEIHIRAGVSGGLLEPASLSHGIVTGLLRQELGFRHLVLTDDLEMGAIARYCNIEAAARRAFLAGNDMLLICARPDNIRRGFNALLKAAQESELPERRIRTSLRRIAATKALAQPPLPLDLDRLKHLSDEVAELNRKLNYTYTGKI